MCAMVNELVQWCINVFQSWSKICVMEYEYVRSYEYVNWRMKVCQVV